MDAQKIIIQVLRGDGGSLATVAGIASQGVRKAGFKSEALVLRTKPQREGFENKSFDDIHYCGYKGRHWKGLRLNLFRGLKKYLLSKSPDVVIVHQYKELVMLLILKKIFNSFKLIMVFHGERDFRSVSRKWLCALLLDDDCHLVAVSDSVKEYVKENLPRTHTEKVTVINNAIDFEWMGEFVLSKRDARRALKLDGNAKIYGTMGRLVHTKAPEVLLKAFAKMTPNDVSPILAYMGEGRDKDKIKNLAIKLNVSNRVVFLGRVADGAKYLKAFDYFVFPSRREGFGLALVEAIAAQVPVIFSNIKVFEAITSSHRLMAKSEDVDDFALKMDVAGQMSLEEMQIIVKEQYDKAEKDYSVVEAETSYQHLIDSVVAG